MHQISPKTPTEYIALTSFPNCSVGERSRALALLNASSQTMAKIYNHLPEAAIHVESGLWLKTMFIYTFYQISTWEQTDYIEYLLSWWAGARAGCNGFSYRTPGIPTSCSCCAERDKKNQRAAGSATALRVRNRGGKSWSRPYHCTHLAVESQRHKSLPPPKNTQGQIAQCTTILSEFI